MPGGKLTAQESAEEKAFLFVTLQEAPYGRQHRGGGGGGTGGFSGEPPLRPPVPGAPQEALPLASDAGFASAHVLPALESPSWPRFALYLSPSDLFALFFSFRKRRFPFEEMEAAKKWRVSAGETEAWMDRAVHMVRAHSQRSNQRGCSRAVALQGKKKENKRRGCELFQSWEILEKRLAHLLDDIHV